MDRIRLSPRLQSVADAVPPCNILADVGTDHAYIPIYLVKNGIVKKAIAGDVATGPLKIADANIHNYELDGRIETKQAYGLKSAYGADVIIVAGMGGKLICDILKEDIDIASSSDALVLQPMTCNEDVRLFLHKNGFEIIDECLAKEEEKIYNIITAKKGVQVYEDSFYYYIGKSLFDKKDALLIDYLMLKAEVLKKRMSGMKCSKNPNVLEEHARISLLYDRIMTEVQNYG